MNALCCWSRYVPGDFDIVYGNIISNCKMYVKLNIILILVTVQDARQSFPQP